MQDIIIYHNPRCRKSRAGLDYLSAKKQAFQIRKYMSEHFTFDELDHLLSILDMHPLEIIRTKEEYYKQELKGKEFSRQDWIEILVRNPQLIKRPIVVNGNKAVLAEIPQNMDKILE